MAVHTVLVDELSNSRYGSSTIAFTFLGLVLIGYLINILYVAFLGPLSKFPGPPFRALSKLPAIQTMFAGRDGEVYAELHRQYGPIVRIAPHQLSYNGGAKAWNEIYGFRKPGTGKLAKDKTFYGRPMNGVDGPITADDANHSRQRKILSHAFSDKALKEQEPLLKHWAEKMQQKMLEQATAGKPVDVLKMLNCTTFDIMGDLTFAESLDMLEESEYSPWVKTIFASIKFGTMIRGVKTYSPMVDSLVTSLLARVPAVQKKAKEHFGYSSDRVDRRLDREPERPDLWSRILEKSPLDAEGGLTLGEHHSIASLFMLAGTETTATALSGTTYHLLKNPDTMAKLNEEVRSAFLSFEDMHLESLARQKYLVAVIQEGLRMYPPVPIALPRRAPEGGVTIEGEYVPAGTTVGVHHLATNSSKTHFKHAKEFRPERWLGAEEFKDDHLDAMEPFSVGPRNCLGKNLAWHEMRLLLATLIFHFDIKLNSESEQWDDQKIYTLWEKKPLMCTLTPVQAAA
ncbi:hypothetical protein LTR78_007839 [Recurvomyces mirabilis]|uniref:Uncharacterized protein n=1 Tax=Recurvomyces mirabilis TaxID=574656 RepID=A0AAE0WFY7_9PEZI|nr:hypothetical protein LTR78_007839 [Recurvomyces mirabilis]KAK5160119.1 hypothetical protein LTS14_002226 [Recurvomyces mirabilis]